MSENGESPTVQRSGWKYDYNLEEDRRLLYVAITRAKNRITIIYPEESPAEILKKWKLI
jgi:superfamily I DNA/RNA helicase